jgi:transposase
VNCAVAFCVGNVSACAKWSWLKAWTMKIARHRGMKKTIVALARRLAVILHRIWVDGTDFRWTREVAAA